MSCALAVASAIPLAAEPSQGTPAERELYQSLAGNYEFENGNVVGVDFWDESGPALLYSDYKSGVVRRLFSIAGDRFGMGPGFAIASPVELAIRFIKDEKGAVTGLAVQPPDRRELVARRLALGSQDVTFTSGDTTLSGTLLTPAAAGRHPASCFSTAPDA